MEPTFSRPSELVAWSLDQDLGSDELNATLRGYYASFRRSFGPSRRHKYDLQLDALSDAVRSGAVRSVLDLGCGCGSVSLWLASLGASVTAVDVTGARLRVGVRRAEIMGLPIDFRRESVLDLQGQYDAIWLEQALHHMEPRAEIFAKLAALLRPGGRIYISESNAWNPAIQAALFLRRGLKTIRTIEDEDGRTHLYGVERIMTAGSLARGLKRHGLKSEGVRYFGVVPNGPRFEKLGWVDRITPTFVVPAFTHYLYTGRREPAVG